MVSASADKNAPCFRAPERYDLSGALFLHPYELEKLLEGKDYTDTDLRKVISEKLNEMPPARNDFRGSSDFRKSLVSAFLEDILTSAVKGDSVE